MHYVYLFALEPLFADQDGCHFNFNFIKFSLIADTQTDSKILFLENPYNVHIEITLSLPTITCKFDNTPLDMLITLCKAIVRNFPPDQHVTLSLGSQNFVNAIAPKKLFYPKCSPKPHIFGK